jgi:nitrite reductase/ring-hydroxylating ferredoxin subunit
MDAPNQEFVRAASLEELEAKGSLVVHGHHRPILVVYDRGRVFALDNRCPTWASHSNVAASRTAS